jgi:hypothetical protein
MKEFIRLTLFYRVVVKDVARRSQRHGTLFVQCRKPGPYTHCIVTSMSTGSTLMFCVLAYELHNGVPRH